jgi:hypothetical protein
MEFVNPDIVIEGSGRDVTLLRGGTFTMYGFASPQKMTRLTIEGLNGAALITQGYATLSDLTVRSRRMDGGAIGIAMLYPGDLNRVTVEVEASLGGTGVSALPAPDRVLVMNDVFIHMSSPQFTYGLQLSGRADLNNIRVENAHAGLGLGGTAPPAPATDITIRNSRLVGTTLGVVGEGGGTARLNLLSSTLVGGGQAIATLIPADFRIASSQVTGAVALDPASSIVCVGAYNGSFAPLGPTCN